MQECSIQDSDALKAFMHQECKCGDSRGSHYHQSHNDWYESALELGESDQEFKKMPQGVMLSALFAKHKLLEKQIDVLFRKVDYYGLAENADSWCREAMRKVSYLVSKGDLLAGQKSAQALFEEESRLMPVLASSCDSKVLSAISGFLFKLPTRERDWNRYCLLDYKEFLGLLPKEKHWRGLLMLGESTTWYDLPPHVKYSHCAYLARVLMEDVDIDTEVNKFKDYLWALAKRDGYRKRTYAADDVEFLTEIAKARNLTLKPSLCFKEMLHHMNPIWPLIPDADEEEESLVGMKRKIATCADPFVEGKTEYAYDTLLEKLVKGKQSPGQFCALLLALNDIAWVFYKIEKPRY